MASKPAKAEERARPTDDELTRELERRLEDLRQLDRAPWWIRTLPSVALALATALGVFLFARPHFLRSVEFVLAYTLAPIGPEAWVALGSKTFGLPYGLVGLLLFLVNVDMSLFVALVLPVEAILHKMPRLGRRVLRFEQRIKRSRLAQRSLVVGLAVAVALPVHSGGAVLATAGGRFMGLAWWRTVLALALGLGVRITVAVALAYGLFEVLL